MSSFISYISHLDYAILEAIQSIGPGWKPVAHVLSHGVGSYVVMAVVFFLALLCIDKWRVAAELFVVTLVSFIVLYILKEFFAIERPYIIDPSILHYDTNESFAFPSGHALMSVVILGWLMIRHPKSQVLRICVPTLIVLIGLSRIYLGVHFPTQVIAGWLFGMLLLMAFKVGASKLWAPFKKDLSR